MIGELDLQHAAVAAIDALWPLCASTEALLASGGDDRLTLDPVTGLNRYGCAPWPRPDVVSFGSCTASSITAGAFQAADETLRQMVRRAWQVGCEQAVADACVLIEAQVLRAFGALGVADAILTASGTDAALVITGLLAAEQPRRSLTSIVVSPAETGSGVPLAVQGCHFAGMAPSGSAVPKGAVLHGLAERPRLVTIALRDEAGLPLPESQVAALCEAAIAGAAPLGRVVLHAIDGSKTGLAAPSISALKALAQRYGSTLDIVIDACQARLEPAMVRRYLMLGYSVLVTGSKFFGAPGFCGAVLIPHGRLARMKAAGCLPAGMAAYTGSDDGFGSRRCAGLILRWTAALHEMTQFAACPDDEVGRRLDHLGTGIERALHTDARFCLVPAPRPAGMGWSDRRSVFTFTVNSGHGPMSADALRPLYLALQADVSGTAFGRADTALASLCCQIGQPVQLGSPSIGGLRIAVSAAQIIHRPDVMADLNSVIRKTQNLLDAERVRDDARETLAVAAA